MQHTAENHPTKTLTIKPTTGWAALDLKELIQYRDLLFVLAGRDIKLRYRQTALGPIWIVLQPLMAAGVFSFIFGGIAKLTAPGHTPYFLFAFSGQLGWNLFANTLNKVGGSLTGNAGLVSKVYFPRLILPLASVISVLVDFVVAACMMLVLMAVCHQWGGIALLTVPIWMALLLMLGIGIGLCTGAAMVTYRDVGTVVGAIMMFLVYISPVGYTINAVPVYLRTAFACNPVAALLGGFRWSVLGVDRPDTGHVVYGVAVAVAVLLVGLYSFKRMERKFADVI